MTPQKVIDFIGSKEHDQMIEDLGSFLSITWGTKEMPFLINLTDEIVREKKLGEELRPTIKKWLSFLDEEKVNALENYIKEKYQETIENLWQEPEPKVETEKEESFDEREKRYLELMKEILKLEPKTKKETKEEPEKKKTIVFPLSQETSSETKEEKIKQVPITWEKVEKPTEPELPEGTIIIKKKEEEKKVETKEDFLDLSNL